MGITILGPESSELPIEVDFDLLLTKMHQNLNSYWKNWITKSSKLFSLASLALFFKKESVEWGVLGITRLYYTFREKKITTKLGAGEYALEDVPAKWHKIIQESIHVRKGIVKSLYFSKMRRKKEVLEYMQFILEECNNYRSNG